MLKIEPGTSEWHAARCGAWTASRAPALMDVREVPPPPVLSLIGERPKRCTDGRMKVLDFLHGRGIVLRSDVKASTGVSDAVIDGLVKAEVVHEQPDPAGRSTFEPNAPCRALVAEIVCERMTGDTTEHFVTGAMQRGLDLEPDALAEYQFRTGYALEPGGLVVHPELPQVAATPDGFVACAGGLVETKCPSNRTKHLAALLRAHDAAEGFAATLKSVCPAVEYGPQAQWQMWVTGRPWVDLVSYDPRWPGDQCLAVLRVEADPEMHERFRERVAWAEAQVSEAIGAMA